MTERIRHSGSFAGIVGVTLLVVWNAPTAFSDGPAPKKAAVRAAASPKSSEKPTGQQEAAALEFAKEHHPQLATLVRRLKRQDPAEYAEAINDLLTAHERISRWQQRQPARYHVELDLWRTDSRIRLVAARMATDDRPALEKELRSLLNQRTDLRLSQMKLERDRLAERIERLDASIDQTTENRAEAVDRELERLLRKVKSHSKVKAAAEPKARSKDASSDKTPAKAGRKPSGPTPKPFPAKTNTTT